MLGFDEKWLLGFWKSQPNFTRHYAIKKQRHYMGERGRSMQGNTQLTSAGLKWTNAIWQSLGGGICGVRKMVFGVT